MGRKNEDGNPGAVVGLLGFLVFFIGLCGTIGSFLFAAAEGRGRWTVFYGAIVWGLVQIIWGFVIAIRAKNARDRGDELAIKAKKKRDRTDVEEEDEDEDEDGDEESRPARRRKSVQEPARIPVPVLVGCGVAGGLLLLSLAGFAAVMIIVQSLANPEQHGANGDPPGHPKDGIPINPVEPAPEDLGPKAAQTPIVGATQDPTFKDQAPDGGVLVGFDVRLGQAFGVELVRAIQPRYQTPNGEVMGRKFGANFTKTVSVTARPGYAVGAINVKAGLVVNGFSVTFMRLKGNALDRTDSYTSAWIGDQTGGNGPTVLGGDGTQIVGIIGKRNARECNGLGLLKRS
ncbi:MAG: hypothetical protein HYX68_24230 [Planctomycetes bacterium]|nr:hypothetical protein [Planctomycetota bacterium]